MGEWIRRSVDYFNIIIMIIMIIMIIFITTCKFISNQKTPFHSLLFFLDFFKVAVLWRLCLCG